MRHRGAAIVRSILCSKPTPWQHERVVRHLRWSLRSTVQFASRGVLIGPHSPIPPACATNRSRCYDFLSSIFQQLRCGHHHAVARSSPFLPFGMQCKAVAVLRIPLIHLAAPPRQPCGFFSSTITRTRTKTKTIARTSRTRPRRGCGSLFLRVTEVVPRRDRRTERTRTADAERNAPGGGQVSVQALRAHSSAVAIIPVQKRWELKINEADGYLVSHIWMNPGAPEGVGARYQPLSDSLRSRRSLCETRIHPPRGGPRTWWILRSAQPIAHSSIIIPRFFFHSLRAFRRNELLHTLTLGQALMPAGLSDDGADYAPRLRSSPRVAQELLS